MLIFLYGLILFSLALYSFALVDPNITFFTHPLWASFREAMIPLGYYQRELSSWIYIILVTLLFLFNLHFTKNFKKISIPKILFLLSILCLISYPFLSHDFFNYMFDARIVTFYHQNPYFHKALDYPTDQWLRFMHWTHRNYPYGPIWLLVTLIPSALSMGKFILNFILFKLLFILFYVATTLYLNKLNKKWAVFFATNPLIIIDGLVNTHNDLISVCFGIIGIFYLIADKYKLPLSLNHWLNTKAKRIFFGWIHFLFSACVKYTTLSLLILFPKLKNGNSTQGANIIPPLRWKLAFLGVLIPIAYLSIKSEIQPWYFLPLFVFLPFYDHSVNKLNIFFAGLLFSYYPYIRFGGWADIANINLKHTIIITFTALNAIILGYEYLKSHKEIGP